MPSFVIGDDFYPGISIYRNLRQSPESVVNRYGDLLEASGFELSQHNYNLLLQTSRELYRFLEKEGRPELLQYESTVKSRPKLVRGVFLAQFELVFEVLSRILEYARDHPQQSIETAASVAILADFVGTKMGRVGATIVRKIAAKRSNSHPRLEVSELLRTNLKPRTPNKGKAKVIRKR